MKERTDKLNRYYNDNTVWFGNSTCDVIHIYNTAISTHE